MRPANAITADIAVVQAAKLALLTGKRFTSMEIGSDAVRRRYTYGEVTVQDLDMALLALQQELAAVNAVTPFTPDQFRITSMPLVYNRGK